MMAEYYFSAKIGADTTLCIAPLSRRRVELSGEDIADASGYYLYSTKGEGEPNDVQILARVTSEEAIWKLKAMLRLA